MASARIRLDRRDQGWADRLRAYRVVIDGAVVGSIKRGGTLTVDTDPGSHELRLTIDWCRSRNVKVELAEGQEARVVCWPPSPAILWPYWTTFGASRYIGVEVIGS